MSGRATRSTTTASGRPLRRTVSQRREQEEEEPSSGTGRRSVSSSSSSKPSRRPSSSAAKQPAAKRPRRKAEEEQDDGDDQEASGLTLQFVDVSDEDESSDGDVQFVKYVPAKRVRLAAQPPRSSAKAGRGRRSTRGAAIVIHSSEDDEADEGDEDGDEAAAASSDGGGDSPRLEKPDFSLFEWSSSDDDEDAAALAEDDPAAAYSGFALHDDFDAGGADAANVGEGGAAGSSSWSLPAEEGLEGAVDAAAIDPETKLYLTDLFPQGVYESHAATRDKCLLLCQVVAAGKALPPDIARPLFDRLTHPMTPYRLSLEIYQTLRQLLASNPNLWTPRPKDWPLFLGVLKQICSIGGPDTAAVGGSGGGPDPPEGQNPNSNPKRAGDSLQHNYPLRKAVLLLQCFVAALYDDIRRRQQSGADMHQSLLLRLICLAELPSAAPPAPAKKGAKGKPGPRKVPASAKKANSKAAATPAAASRAGSRLSKRQQELQEQREREEAPTPPPPAHFDEERVFEFAMTLLHSMDQVEVAVAKALAAADAEEARVAQRRQQHQDQPPADGAKFVPPARTNRALLELLLLTVSSCIDTLKHCLVSAVPGLG